MRQVQPIAHQFLKTPIPVKLKHISSAPAHMRPWQDTKWKATDRKKNYWEMVWPYHLKGSGRGVGMLQWYSCWNVGQKRPSLCQTGAVTVWQSSRWRTTQGLCILVCTVDTERQLVSGYLKNRKAIYDFVVRGLGCRALHGTAFLIPFPVDSWPITARSHMVCVTVPPTPAMCVSPPARNRKYYKFMPVQQKRGALLCSINTEMHIRWY